MPPPGPAPESICASHLLHSWSHGLETFLQLPSDSCEAGSQMCHPHDWMSSPIVHRQASLLPPEERVAARGQKKRPTPCQQEEAEESKTPLQERLLALRLPVVGHQVGPLSKMSNGLYGRLRKKSLVLLAARGFLWVSNLPPLWRTYLLLAEAG